MHHSLVPNNPPPPISPLNESSWRIYAANKVQKYPKTDKIHLFEHQVNTMIEFYFKENAILTPF